MNVVQTFAARATVARAGEPRRHKNVAHEPRPVIQPKLRVGAVDDPLEREADRAAEAVVAGRGGGALFAATAPVAQRKCAACEAEEKARDEPPIQRKCAGCGAVKEPATDAAANAVTSGGRPLSPDLRAYFEPRFGQSLGMVRVHDHPRASAAADGIGARAFTIGNDIAFAGGAYSPQSKDGRRLIAHELAHTIQQAPFIARQPAPPPFYQKRYQERGGGGETDFEETVQVRPAQQGMSIVGSVNRRVIAPAVGGQPPQEVHHGQVNNIRFDPDCNVVIPFHVQFQQRATAQSPTSCQSPPPATAVPALSGPQVRSISDRYIAAMNEGLNGWFAVMVEGCNQPCAGKPIPIKVVASEVTSNPDQPVDIVPRGGRGDSGTICANAFTPSFAVHEGGHQALGAPDEYHEVDPAVLATSPQWGRSERVRNDLSYMNDQNGYGRFVQFHERHFRFVQAFMEAVFAGQGCTISLKPLKSPQLDFRLNLGFGGGAQIGGSTFLWANLFVGTGIPLERQRRFMLELGAQGQAFLANSYKGRNAFMAGARVGVEARTSPGKWGFTSQAFGSAGALYRPELKPYGDPRIPSRTSGYGEAGLGIGLHSGFLNGGVDLHIRAEAALGAEMAQDKDAMRWFRAGFALGGSF